MPETKIKKMSATLTWEGGETTTIDGKPNEVLDKVADILVDQADEDKDCDIHLPERLVIHHSSFLKGGENQCQTK